MRKICESAFLNDLLKQGKKNNLNYTINLKLNETILQEQKQKKINVIIQILIKRQLFTTITRRKSRKLFYNLNIKTNMVWVLNTSF